MSDFSIVNVRVPTELKERAVDTLRRIGLTSSEAVRLLFVRIAEEGRLPFALRIPSKEGIKETEYLLSNPVNAERLRRSLEHARQGIVEYHDDDLVDDEDEDEDEEP